MAREIQVDMSRESVDLEDLSSRLAHKKVCNINLKRNQNTLLKGLEVINELVKSGMIAIYNDPQYKALDCHMVITVHDELIMEVPEDHIKEGADLLVNTMKRVGHSLIDLPMSVDAEVNDYWYGENLADDYLEEE